MSIVQLQRACRNCRDSSIKTYWANIKGLARVAGHDGVPSRGGWLNAALLKRVLAEPLNRSKRFTTAGVKAAQMYKVQRPKWVLAMSDVTEKYAKKRQSQTRTKREAQNWPEGGYAALSKLAKEMQVEVDHLEQKRMWNTRDLYHYQRYLIVLFYSKHALRGDLADVKIKKPLGENWLKKKGNIYEMHIGEHKTSRSHGSIQLKLGPQLSNALDVFVGQALRLQSHGYLLSTLRTRARLQRQDMLRLIRNIMRERLGKNIGVQLIRVLKVSAAAAEIDLAAALQKEMGHSAGMQKKYISR
mgnify:CR=1 FL=1